MGPSVEVICKVEHFLWNRHPISLSVIALFQQGNYGIILVHDQYDTWESDLSTPSTADIKSCTFVNSLY